MENETFTEKIFEIAGLGIILGFTITRMFPAYALLGGFITLTSCGTIGGCLQGWSKYNHVFKSLGLGKADNYPVLKRSDDKGAYKLYEFTLPDGMAVAEFEKHKDALQQFAGKQIDIEYGFKNVLLKEYSGRMKDSYPYIPVKTKGKVEIPFACDKTENIVTIDLSNDRPHLLVAGESGCGKSTAVRSIITYLITEKTVDLFLIDMKRGAEFQIFRKVGCVKGFARNKNEAFKMLELISAEVDHRYDLFAEHDCIDINEYNKKFEPLKYQVMIIDEFAELSYEKESIQLIASIIARSRACGISLILSTQRPSADVITGLIKANINSTLGLKTHNEVNSRVIGIQGLEDLRGKGHGILQSEGKEIELQCFNLESEKAREIIKPFEVEKKPMKETEIIEIDKIMERFENDNTQGRTSDNIPRKAQGRKNVRTS
jgi:S-DNA-T family DNA segregation ATPase FtsK/SpoIIIE